MSVVFLPLMAAVVLAIAWYWWSGREVRNPGSSVDHFHRALDAMRPGEGRPRDVSVPDGEPATSNPRS